MGYRERELGFRGFWEPRRKTRTFLLYRLNVLPNVVAKIVVIDQRETELTRYADVWLRPRIGTAHMQ